MHGRADFELKDSEGWTALICAAVRNSAESALVLLEHGVCIESKDNEDWTPLLHAINQNSYAVVELLLRYRASFLAVTARMENILHIASRRADRRTIDLLSHSNIEGVDHQLCNSV